MTYEIWQWLNGDRNYWQGVKLLAQVAPDHALLEVFKAEATPVNRAMLAQALKRAKTTFAERQRQQEEAEEHDDGTHLSTHDRARLLNRDLKRKYAERRAASNRFHDCRNDEERATLSDEIKAMIEEINVIRSTLAIFERTGQLPPAPKAEAPKELSDVELVQAIKRLRTRISNQKKRIAEHDPARARKSKHDLTHALHEMQRTLTQLNETKKARGI